MQLEINTRRFNLEDEDREKIVGKLENLKRYSPHDPLSARLTLTYEGGRFTGDLSLNLKQHSCHAKVAHAQPDGAAMLAIEHVERQLRRLKDRLKDHRGRAVEGGLGEAMVEAGTILPGDETATLPEETFQLRDLAPREAREIYADSANPFFVFRNRETGRVAVLYRNDDGGMALLQAE